MITIRNTINKLKQNKLTLAHFNYLPEIRNIIVPFLRKIAIRERVNNRSNKICLLLFYQRLFVRHEYCRRTVWWSNVMAKHLWLVVWDAYSVGIWCVGGCVEGVRCYGCCVGGEGGLLLGAICSELHPREHWELYQWGRGRRAGCSLDIRWQALKLVD